MATTPIDEAALAAALNVAASHIDKGEAARTEATDVWLSAMWAFIRLKSIKVLSPPSGAEGRSAESLPSLPQSEAVGVLALTEVIQNAGEAFYRLIALDSRTVAGQTASEALDDRKRFMIEYVSPSKLKEITEYVHALSPGTDRPEERTISEKTALQFLEFLHAWSADVGRADLGVSATTVFQMGGSGDLFVEVTVTPSLEVAFSSWRRDLQSLAESIKRDVALAVQVDKGKAAVAEIQQLKETATATAGEIGDDTLAAHFNSVASAERARARYWAILAGVAIIATVVLAGLTLGLWVDSSSGWPAQLVHLALTLPFAAGAVYGSKVSSRHRAQAWWAESRAAQLHTFTAFSAPLDEERRAMLREQFGNQLFVRGLLEAPSGRDDSASLADAATDLLAAIRQQGKLGSGSD